MRTYRTAFASRAVLAAALAAFGLGGLAVAHEHGRGPMGQPDGPAAERSEGQEDGRTDENGRRGRHGMFSRLDADNDGAITLEEFSGHRNRMLERFDTDKDGSVSKEEIEAVIRARVEAQVARMTAPFDLNDDGTISKDELDTLRRKHFALLDRNDDGKVEEDEARMMMRMMGMMGGRHGMGWHHGMGGRYGMAKPHDMDDMHDDDHDADDADERRGMPGRQGMQGRDMPGQPAMGQGGRMAGEHGRDAKSGDSDAAGEQSTEKMAPAAEGELNQGRDDPKPAN